MTNFDIARDTMEKSVANAEGSAERELENYQKGIEYHLGRFKASFQTFSTDFLSTGLVKGVVDFGTASVKAIDAVTKSFSSLGTIVAGFGASKLFKKLSGGFVDAFRAVTASLETKNSSVLSSLWT